ncbi:MAG: M28 family peptidase, partial [Thermoprotei archaeon]
MKYPILSSSVASREIVPGTPQEREFVSFLRELFSGYADEVRVLETPADTWIEDECYIVLGDTTIECRSMPYTSTFEVEGRFVNARVVGSKIYPLELEGDSIAFIEFPEEPDLAKYIVLELYERGAKAVVFYDRQYGSYRRIVITGTGFFSFTYGSPPPIPVVSILREDYENMLKKGISRINLYVRARTIHNVHGKTVIATINGSSDKEIHITAHHDHWFTGFTDDLVGVETLYQILSRIAKKSNKYTIKVISFTAEEIGAPYYASWYWAWGSRYYLNLLQSRNELDEILADINIDAVAKTPFKVYANPVLTKCIQLLSSKHPIEYSGYDHMDFDSFSYTLKGVPAVTLSNLEEIDSLIYHSTLDNGRGFNYTVLDKVVDLVVDFVKCLENHKPKYGDLIGYLKKTLGDNVPLETRILLSKIENLNKMFSEEDSIRLVTSLFTHAVYTPGLKYTYKSDILGEISFLLYILNNIDEYMGSRIRVVDFDRIVTEISLSNYNSSAVRNTIYYTIASISNMLNNEIE